MVAQPISHGTANGNFNSPYHQDVGRVFYRMLPDKRNSIQKALDNAETDDRVLSVYRDVVTELLDLYVERRSIEPKLKRLAESVGMMDVVRDKYRSIIDALPKDMAIRARHELRY